MAGTALPKLHQFVTTMRLGFSEVVKIVWPRLKRAWPPECMAGMAVDSDLVWWFHMMLIHSSGLMISLQKERGRLKCREDGRPPLFSWNSRPCVELSTETLKQIQLDLTRPCLGTDGIFG